MTGTKILLLDSSDLALEEMKAGLDKELKTSAVEIECISDPCPLPDFHYRIKTDFPFLIVKNTQKNSKKHNEYHNFDSELLKYCQKKFIPLIEYSKEHNDNNTKFSELFQISAPNLKENAISYICSIIQGFVDIQKTIERFDLSSAFNSYTGMLLEIIGEKKCQEYEISQYIMEMYKINNIIYEIILNSNVKKYNCELKGRILSFVLGHILLNAVFRFPGPIVSENALCAYIGANFSETQKLRELFANAVYNGPFCDTGKFYWRQDVDCIVDELIEQLPEESSFEDYSAMRRHAIEKKLGIGLRGHGCNMDGCNGKRGGYYCPYSNSIVCERENCSISSSSWLPQGANICRIHHQFYLDWNPLLTN